MPANVMLEHHLTLTQFLTHIAESDSAFLTAGEADRFLPACCAMANGTGGWIVFGAVKKDDGLFEADGVAAGPLEEQLTSMLRDSAANPQDLVSHFRTVSGVWGEDGKTKEILAAKVEPVDWRLRPVCVKKSKNSYRRVEGENVASGRSIRRRLALDALELSRDDETVSLPLADLDGACAASFREKMMETFPQWKTLSEENFFKRTLVLDEHGAVTRAGELLLGKKANPVRFGDRDVPNLWAACETLLPRMTTGLTASCGEALGECFLNALLHAEHDEGPVKVHIETGPEAGCAVISNPGLPRSLSGESHARNYRLMRIFVMAGLARGEGLGLDIIRKYDGTFSLLWDMLELVTVSKLPLSYEAGQGGGHELGEAASDGQAHDEPAAGEPVSGEPAAARDKTSVYVSYGWLPVARNDFKIPAVQEKIMELTELFEEEVSETDEDEYLGTSDDEEEERYSPLVRQVRDTPRMPFETVRDAISELCAEYMSLSELAATLARSEGSLRRHYITSMVKEGLLEMEFPDRVGHPDQRYKRRL